MKIRKSSMLIIGVAVLLLSSMTVSAETELDVQNDVWHYVFPYYQSQTVSDQPNSDIKEIKAEISGDQITLSMTLWPGGEFSRGQNRYAQYIMFYNTSDAWYTMTYSDLIDQEPGGLAIGYSLGEYIPPFTSGEVVVDENTNTITVTMDKIGEDTTTTELYGLTWVWEGYGEDQWNLDHWHDLVGDYDWDPDLDPGENNDVTCWQCNENNESVSQTFPAGTVCGVGDAEDYPYDTEPNCGNGATPKSDTPGFETLAVISALAIAFIILRRRK